MNASQKIAVAVVALAATVALPLSARFLATGTTVTAHLPAATTVVPPPPAPASDACDPDDGTPCPPSWAPFHDVDGHRDCFIAVGPTSVLWCGLPRVFITTS